MIAALYVEKGGAYYGLDGVDPWDEERDARNYAGPHPVVAHPPCKRWGRYWGGGPSAAVPRLLGDDHGMFAQALWAVRTFGGVLEHPEASHAWRFYGLARPKRSGGWTNVDSYGGRSCCVEQGHYGHKARKATWLYAVSGAALPELTWGPSAAVARLDGGFHSTAAAHAARAAGWEPGARLTASERLATPPAFRDLLLSIAHSARPEAAS